MNLSIREIAEALGKEVQNIPTLAFLSEQVEGVVLDSRKIEKGYVFVATPGEKVDGNKFVGQVLENGAKLVITEKTPEEVEQEFSFPADQWGPYIVVEDSFAAIKTLGKYYRSKLTIPIVGITGSVGKTSTKEFIAGVLSEKYKVLKTAGNLNNELGVPLTLLSIKPEHQVAVVEMGISDFGEMTRLSEMAAPDIAVITNIGRCHLQQLGDRDGVLKAKTEIFQNMNPKGEVCLYGGDDKLETISSVNEKKPHFFGLGEHENQEVYFSNVESRKLLGSDGQLYLSAEAEEIPVHVSVPGIHMVINAAAAALVAKLLGLNPEQIKKGIEGITSIAGRNRIAKLSDYILIDDCYNANPVSMKSSIDLLCMGDSPRVAILGDMFELGDQELQYHREVGEYAVGSGVEYIYCIGKLSQEMFLGASQNLHQGTVKYFADRDTFLDALKANPEKLLPKGATILVKASHGMKFPAIVEFLEKEL